MTEVDAVKCSMCKDIIYLRSNLDSRWCSCRALTIGGGIVRGAYPADRIGIKRTSSTAPYKYLKIKVNASLQELQHDWNHGPNKFGCMKSRDIYTELEKELENETLEN